MNIIFESYINYFLLHYKIYDFGKELTEKDAIRIKSLQEAAGSIKEIKIFDLHSKFINAYYILAQRILKITRIF